MGASAGKGSLNTDDGISSRAGMRELGYTGGNDLNNDGCEPPVQRRPVKLYCAVGASLLLLAAMCVVVSRPHERKIATIRDLRPAQTITLPAASAGGADMSTVTPRQDLFADSHLRIRRDAAESSSAPLERHDDSKSGSHHVFIFELVFGLGISIGVVLGLSGVVSEKSYDFAASPLEQDSATFVRATPDSPSAAIKTAAGFVEYPTLMSSKLVQPKRDHSVLSPKEDPVAELASPGMEPLPIKRKAGSRSALVTPMKQTPGNFGGCCSETGPKSSQEMDMWEAVAAELELQRQVSWGDQQIISIRSLRSPANPAGFWSPAASSVEPSFHLSPRV